MYFVGVAATAQAPVCRTSRLRFQAPQRRGEVRPFQPKQLIAPAVLFMALSLQLWTRVTIISQGYELEELRKLSLQNDVLLRQKRLEYAHSSSPARLGGAAKERLGMLPLPPQRMRTVETE